MEKAQERQPKVNSIWLAILIATTGIYLASTLIANVASLRIVEVFGWSLDAGTFIYPITFTLRDVIHKVAGRAAARAAIFTGAFINLMMAGYFWWVANLTPDMNVGEQAEWVKVLGPQWRIVIASIVAMIIAELIDTAVYSKWVKKFGHKYQWGRVLSSNGVSSPIDSLIFSFIAFYGLMPISVVMSIFWSMVWIKLATSVISLPLIYGVRPKQEWTLEGQVH
jgi:uncharacterized integral membrane protein (TIGR00697 family)